MAKNNIREKINRLKDQAINDVDTCFNEFIIEELREGFIEDRGYYLIDDTNYYWYWLELATDLDPIISNLLESYDFNTEEQKDLLLECIEIKKVIDINLTQHKLDEYKLSNELRNEISEDVGYGMEPNAQHNWIPFEISGDEKKQKVVLDTIYDYLTSEWKAIDTSPVIFKQHFFPATGRVDQISWKKPLKYLAEFFNLLFDKGILANVVHTQRDRCRLITPHFSHNNKPLKLNSLISTWPYSNDDKQNQPSTFVIDLKNKFYIN